MKVTSINTRLRAVRAFFNYAYANDYIAKSPCRNLKLLRDRRAVIESLLASKLIRFSINRI
ncbi:hypothetical protein ACIQXQ_05270 [Peribacillus sp. NPDC097198]|uniref:hypothetical protein n=1 Tax=Peribacillus sp. NPDC097198 TaxID=3364397 RepID=UPI0038186CDB